MSKATDEALARLEHKLDFVLDFVMGQVGAGSIPTMRDNSHTCPVCRQGVKYVVDMQDKTVARQCGCKTGKFAPLDLEQFAPPPAAGGKHNEEDRGGRDDSYGDGGSGSDRGPKGQSR